MQRLPQYIKYHSSFDHFHASTPTPESQHIDLSKPRFKLVVIWLESSIAAGDKLVSLYNHCEAIEQRLPQYIKYYSSFYYSDAYNLNLKIPNILTY